MSKYACAWCLDVINGEPVEGATALYCSPECKDSKEEFERRASENNPFEGVSMDKGHEIKVLDHGYVRLVDWMGDDLAPLSAARMSTGNPTGVDEVKDDATRDYLWRHQHSTPFEMAVLQIEVQLPLFVRSQWQRHRTMSYNEFSGRYAEMPDLFYVPEPERVQGQSETNKQGSGEAVKHATARCFSQRIQEDQATIRESYEWSLEEGVSKELARINTPLSQYTRMRVQANLRNWLHFLKLRLDPHAQYEIRVYAEAVSEMIKALWPKTWEVFEEHTLESISVSATEKHVLRSLIKFHGLEDELKSALEDHAGKSRAREFLAKLGLEVPATV